MSHTTGQLVEAEEAPLAVARDPVVLSNTRWPIARFVLRLRMFPVTTDASIHQRHSQIHLEPMSSFVLINAPPPLMVIITALSNIAHNHMHRVNNAVDAPTQEPKVEVVGFQRDSPVCGVSVLVVHPIEVLHVVSSDSMGHNLSFLLSSWRVSFDEVISTRLHEMVVQEAHDLLVSPDGGLCCEDVPPFADHLLKCQPVPTSLNLPHCSIRKLVEWKVDRCPRLLFGQRTRANHQESEC